MEPLTIECFWATDYFLSVLPRPCVTGVESHGLKLPFVSTVALSFGVLHSAYHYTISKVDQWIRAKY